MRVNVKLVHITFVQDINSLVALDNNGAIWSYAIKDNPSKSWLMIQGPQVDLPDPPLPPPPQPPRATVRSIPIEPPKKVKHRRKK